MITSLTINMVYCKIRDNYNIVIVSYFYSFICMFGRSFKITNKEVWNNAWNFYRGFLYTLYSMPIHHKSYCVSKKTGYSRWRWCDLCFSINMPFNTICGLLEEKTFTQRSPDNSSEGYCSDPSPIFMCKLFWKLEFISC
jgi:hypothetical protein